jgi:hypothetical protein
LNPFIRKVILVLLGMAITGMFASSVAGLVQIPFLKLLEYATYDARVRLTGDDLQDPRVVIIDIDEKSLAAEGRWPWRRDKIGRLVEQLVGTYGAEVVAFDMVFAERDENFSLDQLRELARENGDLDLIEGIDRYEPGLDRDSLFANSIAESGRVVLGTSFTIVRAKPVLSAVCPHRCSRRKPNCRLHPRHPGNGFRGQPVHYCRKAPSARAFSPTRWWTTMACTGAFRWLPSTRADCMRRSPWQRYNPISGSTRSPCWRQAARISATTRRWRHSSLPG